MSSSEPVDFLKERRKRRSDEQAPLEQELQPAPSQQEHPAVPAPYPEPEVTCERKPEPPKGPRCSCCGWSGEQARLLLDMDKEVLLCDGCIQVCNEILSGEDITTDAVPEQVSLTPRASYSSSSRTRFFCSFCRKEQAQVARLIAMLNNLFICNVCVGRCNVSITQTFAKASKAVEASE